MRVSRLYTSAPLATGKLIELDDDNGHYVRTVLRLKKDAEIILFNGHGGEYLCTVAEVSRKAVLIDVGQWSDRSVESPLQVILGLGISRGDRMDLTVQKAVELGVNHITPLLTERCVVQFKGEKKTAALIALAKNSATCRRTKRQDQPAPFAGSGTTAKLARQPTGSESVSRPLRRNDLIGVKT